MTGPRASVVVLAMAACVSAAGGPVEPAPVRPVAVNEPSAAGELTVVGEGAAIPGDVRLAVLWGNDEADPWIVISPLAAAPGPDGSLRIAALPSPPPSMILQVGDVGVALGYLVAYTDLDGDGTLTIAQGKPWRWPEFRGGVNRHALVYASGPVREGTKAYSFIGPHPGGLELAHVELTAQCEGDGCRGHDKMFFGPRPATVTLVLPAEPASYRFPNLD
jgi:hypothetical protein